MLFSSQPRKFEAYFWRTPAENMPVKDWLKAQSLEDRKILGKDIAKVVSGGPAIGKPTVDGMGEGLFEIRSTISSGKVEARILFMISGKYLILLHAFIKTTKKTPKHEIEIARTRIAEVKRSNQPP